MEWKKKLFDHEESPPADTWGRISAKLDEEPWLVRKNLSNFEEVPPAPVWEELSAKLEAENFKRKKSFAEVIRLKPVRIAVAAAVLGALALAAYYFISNPEIIRPSDIAANMIDSQKSSGSSAEKPNPAIAKSKDTGISQLGESEKQAEQSIDQAAIEPEPERIEEHKYTPVHLANVNFRIRPDDLARKTRINKFGNWKNGMAIPNAQYFSTGYITVTGENGITYKVSRKVFDIIHYMPGSDNQAANQKDQFVSENNYWQSVFRDWKKKLNSGTFIPDSGNFLDIMDFMQLMQQNK